VLNYSATLNLSGLSDGLHKLTVFATGISPYDPEGGMNRIDATVYGSDSIQFLYDVAIPSVTILMPQNETYQATNFPLDFTLSEKADWIGYSLDGQPLITIAGNTTLPGLSEGPHSLTVYVNDTVGRTGISKTVCFNITQEIKQEATTQPSLLPINFYAAAFGASAVVAVIGLLLYFKRNFRPQG
jgi:hypothetical protein